MTEAPKRRLAALIFLIVWAAAPANTNALSFDTDSAELLRRCQEAKEKAEKRLDAVEKLPVRSRGFANVIVAFNETLGDYKNETAAEAFLKYVSTDKQVRDASHECETDIEKFLIDAYSRNAVYKAINEYMSRPIGLDETDKRLLLETQADFQRHGQDLDYLDRARFNLLSKILIELKGKFGKNLARSKNSLVITKTETAGLPDSFISRLERGNFGTYEISLDYPDYLTFMQNAKDEGARRRMDSLMKNRAAPDNVVLLEEILEYRRRIAQKMGKSSYAELILQSRMAKSPANVSRFLKNLEKQLSRQAKSDLKELLNRKKQDSPNAEDFYSWDFFYYHNKLQTETYGSIEETRRYFPMEKVLASLLSIAGETFSVEFIPAANAPAWHPDVSAYDLKDAKTKGTLGRIYFDLYPRDGKYKHAATFNLIEGQLEGDGSYRNPVSALIANFNKPAAGEPALIKHSEVVTLFHEFGHLLHQTLARSKYARFSATRMPRDFIEAPSQVLENWAWDKDVLRKITSDYESGRPMPDEMIGRIISGRKLHISLRYLRQIFYSTIDQEYHGSRAVDTTEKYRSLYDQIGLIRLAPDTHPQASFGYLMAYAAGYYGYLWSESIAADLSAKLREGGFLNPAAGLKYREEILAPGAGKAPEALVERFLGRPSTDDAFIRSLSPAQ